MSIYFSGYLKRPKTIESRGGGNTVQICLLVAILISDISIYYIRLIHSSSLSLQCDLPFALHVESVSQVGAHFLESTYSRHVPSNQSQCAAPIARLKRVRVISEIQFRRKPGSLSQGSMTRRLCCHSMVYDENTGLMQLELGRCKPGQTVASPVRHLGGSTWRLA
jgi:hypothetical protein